MRVHGNQSGWFHHGHTACLRESFHIGYMHVHIQVEAGCSGLPHDITIFSQLPHSIVSTGVCEAAALDLTVTSPLYSKRGDN